MDEKDFEKEVISDDKPLVGSSLTVISYLNKEFSCTNSQMAVMLTGYCPHRMPTISEDRIFIEPGTEEEIKYLIEHE